MVLVFLCWIVLAFVVASGAKNRGRSYAGFLVISIIFSPLIGGLILLLLGENKSNVERKAIYDGEYKKCPYCAELVKCDAIVCKYCGRDLGTNNPVIEEEDEEDDIHFCPECHETMSRKTQYCPACGAKQF